MPEEPKTKPKSAQGSRPTRRTSPGGSPLQILRTLRHPGRFVRDHVLDPGFAHNPRRYIVQASLAALAMLLILVFVDSLSNAALAAGLASSVVTLFLHPDVRIASIRSLSGGHSLALIIGSGFTLLAAADLVSEFLLDAPLMRDVGLALVVALLIFVMALTDTEPPRPREQSWPWPPRLGTSGSSVSS